MADVAELARDALASVSEPEYLVDALTACRVLKVSRRTLGSMMSQGRLTVYRVGTGSGRGYGRIRLDLDELRRAVRSSSAPRTHADAAER